jgi:hypothetical protein
MQKIPINHSIPPTLYLFSLISRSSNPALRNFLALSRRSLLPPKNISLPRPVIIWAKTTAVPITMKTTPMRNRRLLYASEENGPMNTNERAVKATTTTPGIKILVTKALLFFLTETSAFSISFYQLGGIGHQLVSFPSRSRSHNSTMVGSERLSGSLISKPRCRPILESGFCSWVTSQYR